MSDKDDKEPSISEFSDASQSLLDGPLQKRIQSKFDLVFKNEFEESDSDFSESFEQNNSPEDSGISFSSSTNEQESVALDFGDDNSEGIQLTNNNETGVTSSSAFNLEVNDSDAIEFGVESASDAISMEVDSGESVSFDVDEGAAVSMEVDTSDAVSFDVDTSDAVSFDVDTSDVVSMEVDSGESVSFDVGASDGLSFGGGDDDFQVESNSKPKAGVVQKEKTSPSLSNFSTNDLSEDAFDSAFAGIVGSNESNSTQIPSSFIENQAVTSDDDLFASSASTAAQKTSVPESLAAGLSDINYRPPEQDVMPDIPAQAVKSPISERSSFISDEDSARVHGTIRQLREEREELLDQIKNLKSGMRELQQDNLTLKAALDDIKIEYSIIKKRHLSEVEDLKDRIAISEKKKVLAEDKAKVIELQKQKLEQKIKIDYNQVKQREKTLEAQLEMITIELDSRIQIREQKILELNRKIESLEFNMENIAFRDQKTQDDKRKLEDKLNKIMKTLRHSIKNLEDDIELVSDEIEEQGIDDDSRSGKTKL